MEKTLRKTAVKLSKEAIFILITVASAIVLPQILHVAGAWLGVGGKLGQMLLPMYLPTMIIAFYRGAIPGAIVGLLAPIISFSLTEMPTAALLPYITVELVATGVAAGLLRDVKLVAPIRVLSVQVAAKIVRLVVFTIVSLVANGTVTAASLSAGILTSVPGLALQLVVVSLLIFFREKKSKA